jgi:hypothetical protein
MLKKKRKRASPCDLQVREKKSASWSKTTNLHPESNEVLRMSEAEAITDFVGWLRGELKGRFSNAKHVLRGHYATTVDFPALALLALVHCVSDLKKFVWEVSKHALTAVRTLASVVPSRTSLPSRARSPGLEAPSQPSLIMSAGITSHTRVPLSMRFARCGAGLLYAGTPEG